eukprot:TRINITY_DN45682_c0_g1_i1.p1 TRINITY_DN45682_c0_g1~~TRINITY_DN45682_c0_g1_i1.p1  ORF type:complete len:627 (-),score=163.19 TRINITY_DN45682_c0_g1_i1:98-1978(-)
MFASPAPFAFLLLLLSAISVPAVVVRPTASRSSGSLGLSFVQVDASQLRQKAFTPTLDLPINEEGFQLTLSQRSSTFLGQFIRKVLDHFGGIVLNEDTFQHVVPFYGSALASKKFDFLVRALFDAPWVDWSNATTKTRFYISIVKDEEAQRRREALSDMARLGTASGAVAALNEVGYQAVVDLRFDAQMEVFVRRLIAAYGANISGSADELRKVVPYYSGTLSMRSFEALLQELRAAPWLSGFLVDAGHASACALGAAAPLVADTLTRLTQLGSSDGVELFVRRLVAARNASILDPPQLHSLAAAVSAANGSFTLERLMKELSAASWLSGFAPPAAEGKKVVPLGAAGAAVSENADTSRSEDVEAMALQKLAAVSLHRLENSSLDMALAARELLAAGTEAEGEGENATVSSHRGVSYAPSSLEEDPILAEALAKEVDEELGLDFAGASSFANAYAPEAAVAPAAQGVRYGPASTAREERSYSEAQAAEAAEDIDGNLAVGMIASSTPSNSSTSDSAKAPMPDAVAPAAQGVSYGPASLTRERYLDAEVAEAAAAAEAMDDASPLSSATMGSESKAEVEAAAQASSGVRYGPSRLSQDAFAAADAREAAEDVAMATAGISPANLSVS